MTMRKLREAEQAPAEKEPAAKPRAAVPAETPDKAAKPAKKPWQKPWEKAADSEAPPAAGETDGGKPWYASPDNVGSKGPADTVNPGQNTPAYADEVLDAFNVPKANEPVETADDTEPKLAKAAATLHGKMKSKLGGKDAVLGPYSAMIDMLVSEVAEQFQMNRVDVIRGFTDKFRHEPVMYFEIEMSRPKPADTDIIDHMEQNKEASDATAEDSEGVFENRWIGFSRDERQALLKQKIAELAKCRRLNEAVYRSTGVLAALEADIRSLGRSLGLTLRETTTAGAVATVATPLGTAKPVVIRRPAPETIIAETPFPVLRNPDRAAFAALLEQAGGRLNGLLDQDLVVWPATAARHLDVARRHGVAGVEVEFRTGNRVVVGSPGLLAESRGPLGHWASSHPAVKRVFGGAFRVLVPTPK